MNRENKKENTIRNITGRIHVPTPSHVKYAAGQSFQQAPGQITGITALTVFTVSIWTTNRETGSRNVMDAWNRSESGSGRMENGQSYTAV